MIKHYQCQVSFHLSRNLSLDLSHLDLSQQIKVKTKKISQKITFGDKK